MSKNPKPHGDQDPRSSAIAFATISAMMIIVGISFLATDSTRTMGWAFVPVGAVFAVLALNERAKTRPSEEPDTPPDAGGDET